MNLPSVGFRRTNNTVVNETKMDQQLWKAILYLRKEVTSWSTNPEFCCWSPLENKIQLNQAFSTSSQPLIFIHFTLPSNNLKGEATHLLWQNNLQIKVLATYHLEDSALAFLKAYLPYCFFSIQAKKRKSAFAIAHFAQTLDGKIATQSGHSKWIGNEENLKHAHRMRALCDGILIGRSTLHYDRPKLTVRHVSGENPSRIVLGAKASDYSCLTEASDDPILVISSDKPPHCETINHLHLPSANGRLHSNQILECLYQQGVNTVYVEGGAVTTSNFIKDKAIDVLQLHLSPQIFGSGRQGIQLPQINEVQESIQFSNFFFQQVGDTQMFVGHLNWED